MTTPLRSFVVTDEAEAKKYWDEFSPHVLVYDRWDYRYTFYQSHTFDLHFQVFVDNNNPVALLPLQYNRKSGIYEYFGVDYMEQNRIMLKQGYESYCADILLAAPRPCQLDSIELNCDYIKSLPLWDYKYIQKLTGLESYNDFIEHNFSSKSKKNKRHELTKLTTDHSIRVIRNRKQDMNQLVSINIENFGEESCLARPGWKEIFNRLLELPLSQHLLTFEIDGKIQAVSYGIYQNGIYTYVNAGVRNKETPNLGKFVILTNIDEAIHMGASIFDAGQESLGWKEEWHLEKIPLYSFKA